jgi:cyanate lyase
MEIAMKERINHKLKGRIVMKYGKQIDFAHTHGIDETYVCKVITGRRQLSEDKQKQWAQWLDCKPEDIFADEL